MRHSKEIELLKATPLTILICLHQFVQEVGIRAKFTESTSLTLCSLVCQNFKARVEVNLMTRRNCMTTIPSQMIVTTTQEP